METLLIVLGCVAILLASGALYQAIGTAADRRRYPPLGRLIDIGSRRLHLFEKGRGRAVIFESGISATCLNWTVIQNETAQFARAVTYDRASLGWSDPASSPRTLSDMVDDLNALLTVANLSASHVLVGHSFGGLLVRAYAVRYPDHVAGLVLVDPVCITDWANLTPQRARMIAGGAMLARRGALLARLGVVRLSLVLLMHGGRRVPQTIAKVTSGPGEGVISRIVGEVRKMPPQVWPMIRAHWCLPASFRGLADYLEALPPSAMEGASLEVPARIPMTILSATTASPAELAERRALIARTPQSRHVIAAKSGHWVHLDEPELVIQAIREMLDLTGSATPS